MTTYVITAEMEILFGEYLEQDEKSKNTIEKYRPISENSSNILTVKR